MKTVPRFAIPRGERLVAVPFWLISYKIDKSVYMLKIDAETGEVLPEWHPYKESINWKKIAAAAFVPLVLISLTAVLLHPVLFILDAAVVILRLLGYEELAYYQAKFMWEYFKKLIDQFLQNVTVLSYSEIDGTTQIQSVGNIVM